MATSTQTEILEVIIQKPGINASGICKTIQLSRADVYYHLDVLIKTGQIEQVSFSRKNNQVGRPSRGFVFKNPSIYDNFRFLLEIILTAHPELLSENQIHKLAEQFTHDFIYGGNNRQLLDQAVNFLNKMNYQSSWEASKTGPRMIFKNCPYSGLVQSHPNLCILDNLILENLLKKDVFSSDTRFQNKQGKTSCIFEFVQL